MAHISCVLTILLSLVTPEHIQTTADTLATGMSAPSFYVSTLDGSDFFLSRKVGAKARPNEKAPVVLVFFTTSCIPCRQEIPFLDSLRIEYPQIAFYLVNVAEEPQIVKEYVQKMEYKMPVLLDRYGQIAKRYQASITPTLVGININGRIAFFKRGFQVSEKYLIRQNIEKLTSANQFNE
ncbi:MAG TPA: TlpA disulfide reductase family protein [Candidatus Marinimicrobia bacterium]|nr:TlpA disulfide reductase family protein [Candidatus Neomarinimicrobiota bacterium]